MREKPDGKTRRCGLNCNFAGVNRPNMERHIDINQFDYDLPDRRIAKFPLAERSASKLLVYRNGAISESRFDRLGASGETEEKTTFTYRAYTAVASA